jgi:uncharacterized membrane protein (UPF0127 family)
MRQSPTRTERAMRNFRHAVAILITAFMTNYAACAVAASQPVDSEQLVIETRAGVIRFFVELALTPATRASGLMNRTSMAADHGMLFRFDQTRPVLMWMKNTPLSLDMLFIDAAGTVVGIAKDTTPNSEIIIPSPEPVRYVLELNAGTAAKSGISTGDKVQHRVISE